MHIQSNKGSKVPETPRAPGPKAAGLYLLCVAAILLVLFHSSFNPDKVVASNDGPLGAEHTAYNATPGSFLGSWQDLNGVGVNNLTRSLNLTAVLRTLLGPVYFSKFFVPIISLFVGFSAWVFFRQLGLSELACFLGGLAAMLNSAFFSPGCWGVGPQEICYAFNFLALAAVVNRNPRHYWLRTMLAGFAVGLAVTEGADIGVLFSLLVATFVLIQTWVTAEGSPATRAMRSVGRVAVVAACAGFIAIQAVVNLWSTNIKGVAGTQQDADTKAQRWSFATQGSFSKRETLTLFIPGLFGYRMDTPNGLSESLQETFKGATYWGATGRDVAWDEFFRGGEKGQVPGGSIRASGGGAYAGVVVCLIALWAVLQSFRREASVFNLNQRKFVWFWTGLAVFSLLMAYGRFAPFFQFLYALPYASVIRNPSKFLNPLSWSIVTLFGCGVHGLSRRYLQSASGGWLKASAFDKRWILGSLLAVVLSLVGWFVYTSSRHSLEQYLAHMQELQPTLGSLSDIAAFSIRQVGWFVVFLAASVVVVTMILLGKFSGSAAKWGGVLLGLILVVDLARANLPWIIHWNYKQKYDLDESDPTRSTNPIVNFLSDKPYEHRVAILQSQFPGPLSLMPRVYELEWKQHHFLYYNIQNLDVVQSPRTAQEVMAYEGVTRSSNPVRRWELTNTRYLLGPAMWPTPGDHWVPFIGEYNRQVDPALQRFRIIQTFELGPKPGVLNPISWDQLTAVASTNGRYAIIEFTGALPRAQLFSNWKVSANDASVTEWIKGLQQRLPAEYLSAIASLPADDQATLKELVSESFDPHHTLLLAKPLPGATPLAGTNQDASVVEFTSYQPTEIKLKTNSDKATVLLLNDKYDPMWHVSVDGKPAELLRCNFIMRGVALPAGSHAVEFVFRPPLKMLYVSAAGIVVAVLLLGFALVSGRRPERA